MNIEEIKSIIMHELPGIVRTDDEVRRLILDIGREQFLDQSEANRRFDRILDELAEQRRENNKKWEVWEKTWDENQRRSDEKWEKNHLEIKKLYQKYESGIGALGARWGIYSEQSFRNGLSGILEETLGLEVININEFDDEGYVYGRPDQVELDIIIRDGTLIICELKSSISKSEMYTFERKVRFYEKRHKRQANKMIVISPMVDKRAKVVAEQLGIEVYTHAEDVEEL